MDAPEGASDMSYAFYAYLYDLVDPSAIAVYSKLSYHRACCNHGHPTNALSSCQVPSTFRERRTKPGRLADPDSAGSPACQGASSTPALRQCAGLNRFTVRLRPHGKYDGTTQRWRLSPTGAVQAPPVASPTPETQFSTLLHGIESPCTFCV
ncbi:hypothetical protein LZ32DRAFT_420298 [Colletotrichum eremochloae]|nr:hypothetical protein LZ32DRAFT_420298 [Colletotrichum eremochloae]